MLLLVRNRGAAATTGAERIIDELVQVEEGAVEAANGHCEWIRESEKSVYRVVGCWGEASGSRGRVYIPQEPHRLDWTQLRSYSIGDTNPAFTITTRI